MEKVRPGTGREAGLGHAGGRAAQDAVAEDAGSDAQLTEKTNKPIKPVNTDGEYDD